MKHRTCLPCLAASLVWLATVTPAVSAQPASQPSEPIPVAEWGAKAGAPYHGDGLSVMPTPEGARLVLDGSGRKLACNRLQVADAEGKELTARMEVTAETRLVVLVEDAAATYPVRIEPTFSDADSISMGGLPGADTSVKATVVDDSGNLCVGGDFTMVGGVLANHVPKWDGIAWSALGTGVGGYVSALAVSASDLYVGGGFMTAGGKTSAYVARANLAGSPPVFTSIVLNPSATQSLSTFNAVPGASYYLLSSTNLTTWQTNATVNASAAIDLVRACLVATAGPLDCRRAVAGILGQAPRGCDWD